MPVSDAEYSSWLESHDKDPVYIVQVDAFDPADTAITVRASDRRYYNDSYDYLARLTSLEMLWELEPGLFTESHIDTTRMELTNVDKKIDSWKDYRYTAVRVKRGDRAWPESDFRTVFDGEVYDWQGDHKRLYLVVASRMHRVNVTVKDGDFAFQGGGLPGTVAKSYLTDATGGLFALSDLDTASFDAADVSHPYNIDVDPDAEKENYLGLVDRAFSGLPLDLCVKKDGTLFVAEFTKPAGSSAISSFLPLNDPEIEIVPPLGEITVSNTTSVDTHESFRESASIKADYPNNWRSLSVETEFTSASRVTHTESLGDAILALFDRPYDRVRFRTNRELANVNLGDEIMVQFPRYGYDAGKYGIVTYMREELNEANEMEVMV